MCPLQDETLKAFLRQRGVAPSCAALVLFVALSASAAAGTETAAVEVVIEGLTEELERNVRATLSLEHHRHDPELSEWQIGIWHARAPQEIRRALEPFGYYRAHIEAELQPPASAGAGWTARYRVDPGPPLTVAALDLRVTGDGREDPEFRRLVESFPLKPGDPLRHDRYEEGKRAWLALAAERGYFDARLLEHALRIDLERYRAEVVLHLDTGARYRFGEVRFEQDFFDPAFLARFVPFARGDPYTNTALLRLQASLADTDYFEEVRVQPRRDLAQDDEVPIEVALRLRPRDRYHFGLGYGTDTGARGKLGWEQRRVNPAGHRAAAELDLSEIRRTASARYRIPLRNPVTDQLVFSTALGAERMPDRSSDTATVGARHERARGRWRQALSLDYLREIFTAGGETKRTSLLTPGASWIGLRADDPVHPRRGRRLQLDLRAASQALLSDISFWQARLAGKFLYPLGGDGRLIVRGEGGYTHTTAFEDLPTSLRFYAGGSQSVRGYAYQSLGPSDDSGRVVGARYLLLGSLEYDHRLTTDWSTAVFYDAGKAFDEAGAPFAKGAGFGVRWYLPIGVLRLDVARALSREGRPWRVHFWIGPDL